MSKTYRKRLKGVVDEDGLDSLHVRQVISANLRKVEKPYISWEETVSWHPFQKLFHRETHDSQMYRNVSTLRYHFSRRTRYGRGKISGLTQQRGTCSPHNDKRHFFRYRGKSVTDDL